MDEFDNGDFNIDDILNDKELQRELRSLGFAEPEMRERTTPQQNGIPHSEVDMINVAADDNDIAISLDENDLDDPELLQQFEQLNGIEHTEVTTDLEPNNRNEEKFVNVSKTISNAEEFSAEDPPIEKVQIAEDAKALALYWKRAGNNDLALKWFRHAKAINASVLLPSSSEKSNARSKHTAKGSNSKQESQELKPGKIVGCSICSSLILRSSLICRSETAELSRN